MIPAMPGLAYWLRSVLAVLAVACCSACATDRPPQRTITVATPETLEQLRADQRESERVRRWVAKKRLCREGNIRFDSSARCW